MQFYNKFQCNKVKFDSHAQKLLSNKNNDYISRLLCIKQYICLTSLLKKGAITE